MVMGPDSVNLVRRVVFARRQRASAAGFQCGQRFSVSASQAGLGRLPAMAVSDRVCLRGGAVGWAAG